MELVYLWKDKFNSNLKNIELNFSEEYIVKYSSDEKKLKINKNENYIKNFWGTNIKNITGIVGKNGAGKTSVLDCIKGLIYDQGIVCIQENEEYNFYKAILIIKKEESLIIIANDELINDENDIEFSLEVEKKVTLYGQKHIKEANDYEVIKRGRENIAKIVKVSDSLKEISCIYITNIFDLKYPLYNSEQSIYYDLSTNGILDELEKGYINLKGERSNISYINETPTERSNRFDIPLTIQYKFYTLFQQLKFISENKEKFDKKEDLKLKFPNEIILTTDYNYKRNNYDDFLFANNSFLRYENKGTISKFEETIYKRLDYMIHGCNDPDKKNQFIVYKSFIIRIIDSYWQDIHKDIPFDEDIETFIGDKLNSINNEDSINNEITYSLNCIKDIVLESINEFKEIKVHFKENRYLGIIKEIEKVNDLYCKFIYEIAKIIFENNEDIKFYCYKGSFHKKEGAGQTLSVEDRGDMIINLTNENLNKLNNLINSYLELKSSNDFLIFNWGNISSGELALLDIYSKLYSVTNEETRENILLLIDEGELYFHPEWQRQYIKMLVDYLPMIYKDKNIQIIVSSNSPFLISDIPRSNVVLLDKNNKGEIIISDSKIRKQTFGANISKLLNDSFFISNSMGDFAKSKIEEVIKKINHLDEHINDEEYKDYIKKIIDLIDEPIIKKKLTTEYLKKCGSIDEQIKYLQNIADMATQKIKVLKGEIDD